MGIAHILIWKFSNIFRTKSENLHLQVQCFNQENLILIGDEGNEQYTRFFNNIVRFLQAIFITHCDNHYSIIQESKPNKWNSTVESNCQNKS